MVKAILQMVSKTTKQSREDDEIQFYKDKINDVTLDIKKNFDTINRMLDQDAVASK